MLRPDPLVAYPRCAEGRVSRELPLSLPKKILRKIEIIVRGPLSEVCHDTIFLSVALKKFWNSENLPSGLLLRAKIEFDTIRPNIRNDSERSLATCQIGEGKVL